MTSFLAGKLLVASRHLRDPNFLRTVVLILEHTADGALGVVLNRPSGRTVQEVWRAIEAPPCDSQAPIYVGGPVPGPLIALHTDAQVAEKRVLPGLFMAIEREKIDALVRQDDKPFRLYSSNSGWGAGQLESELAAGGWLTTDALAGDVFASAESLWTDVTKRIGLKIMLPKTPPDRLPSDPSMN
ncbi:hypothetical protein Pla175_09620 [Pirellulimonas nuda]|uniref:Uncharacterized protein n=1 Tax=Pirellulimonas nuda TaxID=2528009 RepID=A0A518D7Z3_9BACT|nr:YqgE/AlgH family protein [Pirellulimonas nuda]QDU87597.1 hypothetical protein Pla175_09620 [Pirellulimonas nuda]